MDEETEYHGGAFSPEFISLVEKAYQTSSSSLKGTVNTINQLKYKNEDPAIISLFEQKLKEEETQTEILKKLLDEVKQTKINTTPETFWKKIVDKIVTAVVTAIITLIVSNWLR